VDLAPQHDDIALAMDLERNQNFTYDHPEIPGFNLSSDQTHCPFSAHMRKTRPRADLGNLATRQILRAGIPYGPDVTEVELAANRTALERGLAFGRWRPSPLVVTSS
jgi:deferrochelatase/peroxidase EfeB